MAKKENYMALADFQTLWTERIKPAVQGIAGYVPTLSSEPTSSTTTYTRDGQTVSFEIGQYARVADATADTGYKFFQLYDLNNGVAKWKVAEDYTPEKLGFGIGTCQTAADTAAKEVSITNYVLTKNGYVTVTFENDVLVDATLNINSLGEKPIYFKGEAIVANVIKAGDTVTFCFDGTNYVISHPMKVSKVTIRTWSDSEKTIPTEAILYLTLPNEESQQIRVSASGEYTLYSENGNATVSSLYSALDISSFTIYSDTIVDIVVATTPFVDMGLPSGTFWARGNICKDSQGNYSLGSPEDFGAYFSWGNIDGYYWNSDSDKESYNFDQTTYDSTPGALLTASIASNDATHDAAVARLGSDWHLPTDVQCQELIANTTRQYTTIDGVNGMLFTSTNGNTLFLPASGYRLNEKISRSSQGMFWTNHYNSSTGAQKLATSTSSASVSNSGRQNGMAVRAVL